MDNNLNSVADVYRFLRDIGCLRVKMQVSNFQLYQFPNSYGGIIPKYEEHLVAAFGPFLLTKRVKERRPDLAIL